MSVQTANLELLELELTESVGCEASVHGSHGNGPATWVMWFACCPQDPHGAFLLSCEACKNFLLNYPALRCDVCKYLFTPGRKAYRKLVPINSRL